jgi:segregation and condensation protein B
MSNEVNFFDTDSEETETELEATVIVEEPIAQDEPVAESLLPSEPIPLPEEMALSDNRLNQMIEKIQNRKERAQFEEHTVRHAKQVVEALLFSSNEPLSFQRLRDAIETKQAIKPRHLKEAIETLQNEYVTLQRAFRLQELESGYVLRSLPEYSPYVDGLYRNKRTEKLSHAATEVLAIIAHKQPVTRPQIDAIRGVDSSGAVAALVERGLVEAVGKLEAVGRPTLYGVTQEFLKYFGLCDAKELVIADQ